MVKLTLIFFLCLSTFSSFAQEAELKNRFKDSGSWLKISPQVKLPIEIGLKKDAIVLGPRFSLDDIASCLGPSHLCNQMKGIDLGIAPKPYDHMTISSSQIKTILEEEWREVQAHLLGSPYTTLVSQTKNANLEEIENQIEEFLKKQEEDDDKYVLKNLKFIGQSKIYNVKNTYDFYNIDKVLSKAKNDLKFHSSFNGSIEILVFSDQKFPLLKLLVAATITKQTILPIASHDISAGSSIANEDIQEAWVEGRPGDDRVLDRHDIIDKKMKVFLKKGESFSRKMIFDPPLVRRGDIVDINIEKNGLKITTKAKAKSDGRRGDIVIFGSSNKKEIEAKIVGNKVAEALF